MTVVMVMMMIIETRPITDVYVAVIRTRLPSKYFVYVNSFNSHYYPIK